ncbi:MAG: hypothetical protein J1G30_06310 [Spirochaetales bacterium]|nr:hypothetical protein [Spirochaetales bacterium]
MELYLKISYLNDFIFCPISVVRRSFRKTLSYKRAGKYATDTLAMKKKKYLSLTDFTMTDMMQQLQIANPKSYWTKL